MGGETEAQPSGWTIDTLAWHQATLRSSDREFSAERDRRYAEVNTEREKALKIKETADMVALQLAREIQTYKDEKANELREQISQERGTYATQSDLKTIVEKIEAQLLPVLTYVTAQQSQARTVQVIWAGGIAIAGLALGLVIGFR